MLDRDTIWPGLVTTAGVIASGLVALASESIPLTAGTALGFVAGSWMLLIARAKRRSRRLARLTAEANRLAGLSTPQQVRENSRTALTAEISAADMNGNPRALEQALITLGDRLGKQIKELAKKSRNLGALIDGLTEPVIVTGDDQRVIMCNNAAERMLSLEGGTLIGRSVREVFTREEVLRLHERARAGQSNVEQVVLTIPGGRRTFQVAASPLPAAWGEGVYGAVLVLRDVTELAQAVQQQTDFVANASHELRTPVAALRIAIETLQDGGAEDPAIRDRFLSMCANHVQRLEEMIRDLLDLSRAESRQLPVRMQALDVEELERALRTIFEPICAERGLSLEFHGLALARGVMTDPRLLQLIVRNLIDNATKFAHERTPIVVTVRMTPESRVEGEEQPRAIMRIEVKDKGQGIPLAQQERVFERFFQVDTARTGVTGRRGSGLGLAIVRHACDALGGRVGINSVWGTGTTVWVELPVNQPTKPA
jgi:two-component system phosphate regulon sensor histidine kinase PhoR